MIYKLALITGASSGIGKALAELLASMGINLILTGRDKDRLQELAERLASQVEVEMVVADLKDREERKKLTQIIQKKTPDLIINNAGFGLYGPTLSHSTEKSLELVEVDLLAVLEFSLEGARALMAKQKEGVIMNISSAAGFFPFPYFSVYSASKAFINQFSQSFDEEIREFNIRILTACPGMVKTSFRDRAGGKEEKTSLMTAEFAALEIWKQIKQRKKIHIFDWRYRLGIFFSRLLPSQMLLKILKKNVEKRVMK